MLESIQDGRKPGPMIPTLHQVPEALDTDRDSLQTFFSDLRGAIYATRDEDNFVLSLARELSEAPLLAALRLPVSCM